MSRPKSGNYRHPFKLRRKLNLPLPTASSNLPTVQAPQPQGLADVKTELDRRIATASTNELSALIAARGAIIQQDEWQRENEHLRRGRMGVFYSKIGFSVVSVASGAALIVAGFGLPGLFMLGGAAAIFVPDYAKSAIGRISGGGGNAN